MYGDAIAATINAIDPSLDVQTRNTKGSTENVPLLEAGTLDLGLARYVLDGLGLDQQRDFQAIVLDAAGDGPKMALDGRAAALWGGAPGGPASPRSRAPEGRAVHRAEPA